MRSHLTQFWIVLKFLRDFLAVIIFLGGLAAVFIPSVRQAASHLFASNYGLTGQIYYEVDKSGNLTPVDGRLFLLKPGDRQFKNLVKGDRLMAADNVNLRDQNSPDSVLLVLQGGNCVVVLEPVKEKTDFADPNVGSGGTLLVATGPCELADRPL